MSGNPTKEKRVSPPDSCALYYFPEIPSNGMETDNDRLSDCDRFISGNLGGNNQDTYNNKPSHETEQIQCLIKDAFNNGMEQGRAQTIAEQQKKIENATQTLKSAVDELCRIRQQDVEQMEVETVRLAMAIARKVVGYEIDNKSVIHHVVKEAMRKVGDPHNLTLRLNPSDIDTLSGFKQELLLTNDIDSVLRLEPDETIEQGGCIIETNLGDVDARIDHQIRILEELLTEQLPKLSAKI